MGQFNSANTCFSYCSLKKCPTSGSYGSCLLLQLSCLSPACSRLRGLLSVLLLPLACSNLGPSHLFWNLLTHPTPPISTLCLLTPCLFRAQHRCHHRHSNLTFFCSLHHSLQFFICRLDHYYPSPSKGQGQRPCPVSSSLYITDTY